MTKKKLSPSPLALEAQLPVSCPPLNRPPPPWLPTMNITKHKTIQGHNINIISIQLGSPTGSGTAEKKNFKKIIHQFTVFYRCKKNKKSTRIHQMLKKGLKFWHVIWKSMWTNCYSFRQANIRQRELRPLMHTTCSPGVWGAQRAKFPLEFLLLPRACARSIFSRVFARKR